MISRVNLGLLVFIVVVGLPIVSIPAARGRLKDRVQTLKAALGPLTMKPPPAWGKIGRNPFPVPKEFDRPVTQRPVLAYARPFPGTVFRLGGENFVGATPKGDEEAAKKSGAVDDSQTSAVVEFRQGKAEQEAYEWLLKSNEKVAALVLSNNGAIQFKSWSAARQEEDSYLVDLLFLRGSDKGEIHHIWKVRISSKEITPMSSEARKLSKE